MQETFWWSVNTALLTPLLPLENVIPLIYCVFLFKDNLSARVKGGENLIGENTNLLGRRLTVWNEAADITSWNVHSLWSICDSGITFSVFTATLFIFCVLIKNLTSGYVILVLYWFCVCRPNVIWWKKYCSCIYSVRLYFIEARSTIKIILGFKARKKKDKPGSSYVLQDGPKRARTELRGSVKAGDAVKQRRNGCFLDEEMATESKHLRFSLRHFQKDFLKKVLYMWQL